MVCMLVSFIFAKFSLLFFTDNMVNNTTERPVEKQEDILGIAVHKQTLYLDLNMRQKI